MSTALVKKILTPEDKARALALAADGATWQAVLDSVGLPQLLFWRSMRQDPKFAEEYAAARIAGLHMRSDHLLTAHDGAIDFLDIKKQELYSRNLQWLLSRRLRQEYGDQVHVTTDERPNARKVLEAIDAGLGTVVVGASRAIELAESTVEESEEDRIRRLYSWML